MVDRVQNVTRLMEIDIEGWRVAAIGAETTICAAALEALRANGGIELNEETSPTEADILLVSWNLVPERSDGAEADALVAAAGKAAEAMSRRGKGTVIFLLTAAAAIPIRRHAEHSRLMSAAAAAMRCISMESAPHVRVNALGFGCIGESASDSGAVSMLTHVPLARTGKLDEAVDAVLFMADPLNSYTTGQLLPVDGGWSAGYARSF